MSDLLTPAQIDELAHAERREWEYESDADMRDTLVAYAEVVEAVATMEPVCYPEDGEVYCAMGCDFNYGAYTHASDCAWRRARELRGKA